MATITKVPRKDGHAYRVQVRRDGKYLSRTFARKREADAFAREVEGNLEQHKALLSPELRENTLAHLIDRYAGVWTGTDTATLARLAWWREQFGNRVLAEFSTATVREGLERLRTTPGAHPKAATRAPATINRYCAAIGGCYRVAIKRGWFGITENPTRGIGREPESDRHGRRLTEDERKRLLEACDASRWSKLGLVVRLALGTGMRLGEIQGLRWSDVDLAEGVIRLATTKNGDPRIVPLIPDLAALLAACRGEGDELLFPSRRDPSRPHRFMTSWYRALEQAKIENLRFHDLRHSAASFLTDAGVNLVVIAEILGHRTLQMVKRYSHAGIEAKRDALKGALDGKL